MWREGVIESHNQNAIQQPTANGLHSICNLIIIINKGLESSNLGNCNHKFLILESWLRDHETVLTFKNVLND